MYCKYCGKEITDDAIFCPSCGKRQDGYVGKREKSKVASGLLALFLGPLGLHNFYLGYTRRGLVQLLLPIATFIMMLISIIPGGYIFVFCTILFPLTLLLVWLWGVIEAILIFMGKIRDSDGSDLV